MCKKDAKYSKHFETLVGLVSYMALMDYTSRTPTNLAKYLSLDNDEVKFVLENFKEIFRESTKPSNDTNEKFYCLQFRYATRKHDAANNIGDDENNYDNLQLKAEYLNTLLDFISKMVESEKASIRQTSYNWVTIIASILALTASIIAIILKTN